MKLRLSEAILLGSTLNPKAIGIRHAADGSSCALGAAENALGWTLRTGQFYLESKYHWLNGSATNPVSGIEGQISVIIAGLNNGIDGEPWSRERIADWVATVDPQPQPEPTPEPIEEPVAA